MDCVGQTIILENINNNQNLKAKPTLSILKLYLNNNKIVKVKPTQIINFYLFQNSSGAWKTFVLHKYF